MNLSMSITIGGSPPSPPLTGLLLGHPILEMDVWADASLTFTVQQVWPTVAILDTGLSADDALGLYEAAYDRAAPLNRGAVFVIIDERTGLDACGLDLGTAGGAGGCDCSRCSPGGASC
jgi:hypothetical protein